MLFHLHIWNPSAPLPKDEVASLWSDTVFFNPLYSNGYFVFPFAQLRWNKQAEFKQEPSGQIRDIVTSQFP